MCDLNANRLPLKLAFVLTHLSYITQIFAFEIQGWSSTQSFCGGAATGCTDTYGIVQWCIVAGYVLLLTCLLLIQCLALLDEVRGKKLPLFIFIILVIPAGALIIAGAVYYLRKVEGDDYSSMDSISSGILAILAGICAIISLVTRG